MSVFVYAGLWSDGSDAPNVSLYGTEAAICDDYPDLLWDDLAGLGEVCARDLDSDLVVRLVRVPSEIAT